jgi:hypothetical protein
MKRKFPTWSNARTLTEYHSSISVKNTPNYSKKKLIQSVIDNFTARLFKQTILFLIRGKMKAKNKVAIKNMKSTLWFIGSNYMEI